jgi:hypothetical protein
MGSFGWSETKVQPIHVALSLGLYFAERNESAFKGKFFTFSGCPEIVDVKGNTLRDKLLRMEKSDWGMSTDIERLFDLYLSLAKQSKPEDCPESIIIISDMEFDEATIASSTMFECVKEKFARANVKLPQLVFWNVNASGRNVPVRCDTHGTTLVSGCSPSVFEMVCAGKTPIEFMLDILNGPRYNGINVFKREEK